MFCSLPRTGPIPRLARARRSPVNWRGSSTRFTRDGFERESRSTALSWRRGGHMTGRRFQDMQHAVTALPYADFLVTHDKQLRSIARAAASELPFATAAVVGSILEVD